METERELLHVEQAVFIPSMPDIRIGVETGTQRSNWQNAASQGKLGRRQQWRWYGRFGTRSSDPQARKQWRKPG